MAETTVMVTAVWAIILIATPLPASSLSRSPSYSADLVQPQDYGPDQARFRPPPLAHYNSKPVKDITKNSSPAPDSPVVSESSRVTLAAPPASLRVVSYPPKQVPDGEKDSGNALPLKSTPLDGNIPSQNMSQDSSQANSNQSSTLLVASKGSAVQDNVSKVLQTDTDKPSDGNNHTVEDDDKADSNTFKNQEQSSADMRGEVEGKDKPSENTNDSSESPHPELRGDLGDKTSQNEANVISPNLTKSVVPPAEGGSGEKNVPVEEAARGKNVPVEGGSGGKTVAVDGETGGKNTPYAVSDGGKNTSSTVSDGGKNAPSAVSKGGKNAPPAVSNVVTPSTTTTTTGGSVNINNLEVPKPPVHTSVEDYDDELPSVPGDVGEESRYQHPEEQEPPLPEVSSRDEKMVPEIDSGGKFSDDEDSHFFAYFLTVVVTAIIFYLVFHNKQRIIALIIEGRAPRGRSRRNSSRARYHKLDNNLEEAMSGTKGPKYEQIY